jgi:TPR repeat protein
MYRADSKVPDNFRCHHALGVLHTQAAMADNQSPSTPQRLEHLSKSLRHFTSAANKGDAQSAHNLGLRYLLRDEMVDEIALGQENDGRSDEQVLNQAKSRHESLWGVAADDVEAIKWFERAAEAGESFDLE